MVNTPLLPILDVDTSGGVGWLAVTLTLTCVELVRVTVDPLVVTLDVLTVPRLHTALVVVLVQLPGVALPAFVPTNVEFVPWTVEVNTAPVTGSPTL
jgi:hypothetical protein